MSSDRLICRLGMKVTLLKGNVKSTVVGEAAAQVRLVLWVAVVCLGFQKF